MNPSHQIKRCCGRPLGNRGVAAIEFALVISSGVLLMLGGVDLAIYMRGRMRIDQVSSNMASMVASNNQVYAGDAATWSKLAQQTAGNINVTQPAGTIVNGTAVTAGATVITSIVNSAATGGVPQVMWRVPIGDASLTATPRYGAPGSPAANLPDNYAVPSDSSIIVAEVYTTVKPWVMSETLMSGAPFLQSVALYQPRATLLSSITPGNRP